MGAPKIAKVFFRLKVSPDTAAAQLQSGELGLVLELKPTDFRSSRARPASRPCRSPASASRPSST